MYFLLFVVLLIIFIIWIETRESRRCRRDPEYAKKCVLELMDQRMNIYAKYHSVSHFFGGRFVDVDYNELEVSFIQINGALRDAIRRLNDGKVANVKRRLMSKPWPSISSNCDDVDRLLDELKALLDD